MASLQIITKPTNKKTILNQKNNTMLRTYFIILFWSVSFVNAQSDRNQFSFNEYLAMVKKFHPLAKIANLEISQAQAYLLTARGAFDPKLEADFSKKEFQNKEYYSIFNGGFKIPTWYGIEFKGGYDSNTGLFLNPENTTPSQGLVYAGVSVPILQGLLINQRMADLQKAKINIKLSKTQQKLQAITVLYDASIAYFNWKKNYDEFILYENYLKNAETRLKGILTLIEQGDKPEIDAVEAGIIVKNRKLNKEDSELKLNKARLELSNYLWTNNATPLELEEDMYPENELEKNIQEYFKTSELNITSFSVDSHPKINAIENKISILNVDRKLKANMLLPKIELAYNYLSYPNQFQNYQLQDYKFGANLSFPLFLRKERGYLKLTKYKIEEQNLTLSLEKLQLGNKIKAQNIEITSLQKQIELIEDLIKDNSKLLNSEERLFEMGESSLFLINTRENNVVLSSLSNINIQFRFFQSNAELFKTLANPD
jgi:outer membrane protein TolC